MNKLYLILALCVTLFGSCNKKVKEQPKSLSQICSELYPCVTSKDSIKYDTVYKESPPQYKVVTKEVVVNGDTIRTEKIDTLYSIPSEKIITKTVIRTVLDSALLQTYKDNIFALERRILSNDKEIGTQKLTINSLKGGKRAYLVISIIEGLLLALIALFFGYVWRHNKK
jgi:hypothetical protein